MQLVVFALLGCCVVVRSATLSDTLSVSKTVESTSASQESGPKSLELPSDNLRTKRSGFGGGGGFLAGIGSAILGKVASASSGISSGSSSRDTHDYETVEYGPPVHTYNEENFDVWSFKKAILNTLFQALKAIGGGVIALKGKLIKGGGVIVSAKGNIISAKGEAITSLGRQIAASAVLSPPKSSHSYVYEAPTVHHVPSTGHDSYSGPPPSSYSSHGGFAASASDSYGQYAYAAPSDDAANPGLLIIRPVKQQDNHRHMSYITSSSHLQHDIEPRNPTLNYGVLVESMRGHQKNSNHGYLVSEESSRAYNTKKASKA